MAAYLLVIFDDKGSDVVTLRLKITVVKLLVEQCFMNTHAQKLQTNAFSVQQFIVLKKFSIYHTQRG